MYDEKISKNIRSRDIYIYISVRVSSSFQKALKDEVKLIY